ncbi:MAG: hypothetical protein D4R88_07255, partial [Methanosarcinales archaeon]
PWYAIQGAAGWIEISSNYIGSADTAQRIQTNHTFRAITAVSNIVNPNVTKPITITNNIVNNVTSRSDSLMPSAVLRYCMVWSGQGDIDVIGNTISNWDYRQNPNITANGLRVYGMLPNGTGKNVIMNNTMTNLGYTTNQSRVGGSGFMYVAGMQPVSLGNGSIISGNKITNLYINGPSSVNDNIMGLWQAGSLVGTSMTVSNNQISILGNSSDTTTILGVYDASTVANINNYAYNTILIGGTIVSPVWTNIGFYKSSTTCTSILRNNIFYNGRTGGSAGNIAIGTVGGAFNKSGRQLPELLIAYADEKNPIQNNGFSPFGPVSPRFDSDYNLFIAPSNSQLTAWSNVYQNLAGWQTASGGDMHSYGDTSANVPIANLFRGPLTGDLNIDSSKTASILAADRGTPVAGITTDFNGFTRSATTPDIGSDEFSYTMPIASTLISPANGSTGLDNPTRLVWTKPLFAASYNLQISADSTFATTVVNTIVPDSTYSFLGAMLKYYWRVRPVYAQYGTGFFSNVFNFSMLGTPTRVTLVAPPNGAVDLPVTIQFVWNKAVDGTPAPSRLTSGVPIDISSYFNKTTNKTTNNKTGNKGDNLHAVGNYLIRLTNDTTTSPVYSDSTLTDTTTVLSGFPANQKFYWNISAKNEFGWGMTSVWFNATTIPMPGVPVIVSPPYDTINMPTTVILKWNRSFKAATYSVQTSLDSLFGTLIVNDSLLTDSVKSVSGLLKNTKYYWRVQAVNGAGMSAWAGSRFTTANTPTPVTLVSPNNVVNQPVGATVFKWRHLTFLNLSGYWLEVTTDTTSLTPFKIDSTFGAADTSGTEGGFAYFTNYYWRVKAKNDFGWGDYSWYFKFQSELGPPNLVYPANNEVGIVPTVTLNWDNAPGAATYRMQLSADSTFGSTILNVGGLPTSQYSVPSGFLTILSNYFWRVNSTNVNGTSIYSPVWKFRTMGQPMIVNLVSPANNAVNVAALNTVFNWNKGQDQTLAKLGNTGKINNTTENINNNTGKTGINTGKTNTGKTNTGKTGTDEITMVSKYWFELVTDTVAMTGLVQDTTLTDTTKTLASLSNMTAYYYHVKGKNEIGWGSFSPWNKFTTTVALPTLLTPANNSIDVALSPSLDWSNVSTATSYDVQVATDAGFSSILFDVTGLPTSDYTVPVPLNNFTNYFWRVRATNANGTSPYYSSAFTFRTVPNAPLAPALLSPANGSTGLTLPVTLVWSKVNDAYSYRLQVATDAGFTALVFNDSTLTDTSKVIPGLLPLTTYYWRVNSKNTAGTSAYAGPWNFRALGVPNPVTLISPPNGAIDQPTTVTFVWSKATEPTARPVGGKPGKDEPLTISKYYFELTRDTVTLVGIYRDSTATDTTLTAGGLLTNRDYFWRVKAQNQTGNGSFTGWSRFKTIVANPIVPVLVLPANNAVNQPTTVIFQWRKVNDNVEMPIGNKSNKSGTDEITAISKYYFELTPDTVTLTPIIRDSTVFGPSDTTLTRAGLTNNLNYFWRVRARNQAGLGPFAAWFKFTTIVATPIAPVLTAPANNSTGVSLTPALSWGAVTGAVSYRIQVSTDSLFATSQFDTSGITAATITVPANRLTGLTKYYWRVNATNLGGTGPYSLVWNFRTLQNLTLNLKVYLEGFWNGTTQVSDTTMVYLANSTTPYAFIDTAKVVLSTTGTAAINFTKAPNASYYIVVNHRNHLETWSKLPQAFITNVAVNYDFTTAANKAFGDNMKQVGTVWVLYGGDANRDGAIDALDVALFIVQFGNSGYLSCDFNGDGSVDALDVSIIVANFGLGKAVPTLDNGNPGIIINKNKVIEEIQKKYKLNGESEKKETLKNRN